MTGNAKVVRHSYKVERVRKQYLVFELIETKLLSSNNSINPILTDLVRIEKDRNFHRGNGFDEWLRLRDCNNWSKCKVTTGLMKTNNSFVFYGDRIHNANKNLLIFKFNTDRTLLIIDYYLNYCPYIKPDRITDDLRTILSKYNK